MINLNESDLRNYKLLNTNSLNTDSNIYLTDDEYLYKIFTDKVIFYEEKIKTLLFLVNKKIDNAILPDDLIVIDNQISGYKMKYLKGYDSLKKGVDEITSLNNKLKIIKKLYIALKELHQLGLYLGDIHLDNILYQDDKAYLIDFDQSRFIDINFRNHPYYFLKIRENEPMIIKENYYTDNLKTMICCLSILLNENLEELIIDNNLLDIIDELQMDSYLKKQIIDVINSNDNVIYFDDALDKYENKIRQRIL